MSEAKEHEFTIESLMAENAELRAAYAGVWVLLEDALEANEEDVA